MATSLTAEAFTIQDDTNPTNNSQALTNPLLTSRKDGEIIPFLDAVYALADAHIARYMERGFTHLMFSFGCTGGQHRSVYSAQHLAEHIHHKFGIEVVLEHREQGIHQTFAAK